MWKKWRPVFQWKTLCPVYFADPVGLVVIMPRAVQPVTDEDVESMLDYHPNITSETKVEDHGYLGATVVALDYGLIDEGMVLDQRNYYAEYGSCPAIVVPK